MRYIPVAIVEKDVFFRKPLVEGQSGKQRLGDLIPYFRTSFTSDTTIDHEGERDHEPITYKSSHSTNVRHACNKTVRNHDVVGRLRDNVVPLSAKGFGRPSELEEEVGV